jgi:hypothetical protein
MVTCYEVTESLHVPCSFRRCRERATHAVFCKPLDLWVSCHSCKSHLDRVQSQMLAIEENIQGVVDGY